MKGIPPYNFEMMDGLFGSLVRINYVDEANGEGAALLRESMLNLPNNNMFITINVLVDLLQLKQMGVEVDEPALRKALLTVLQFKSKNYGDKVPIYNFWREARNEEIGAWVGYDENMHRFVSFDEESLLSPVGKIARELFLRDNPLTYYYGLLPDPDDSSLVVAVSAMLESLPSKGADSSPSPTPTWKRTSPKSGGTPTNPSTLSKRPIAATFSSAIVTLP